MSETITPQDRRRLAGDYAAGVQALIAPPKTRALTSARDADDQASQLLPQSRSLTAAAASGLSAESGSLEQAAAEVQLLGGTALDLLVASRLGSLATAETRASAPLPAIDLGELQALVEAPEAYLAGAAASRGTRGRSMGAKAALLKAADDALEDITESVVAVGGDLVEGLLMLDAALLKEAIKTVGGDLAAKLGDDLAGLVRQAIQFVLEAYNKLLILLGRDALDRVQSQLDDWLSALQDGTLFPELIGRLYDVQTIRNEIRIWHDNYQGTEASLGGGTDAINALAGRFTAKTDVMRKVARTLAFVKLAPPVMTPLGRLAIAAAYLGLLAYLIASGYDHIDSNRLRWLDRVEGVRGLSQRLLATDVG